MVRLYRDFALASIEKAAAWLRLFVVSYSTIRMTGQVLSLNDLTLATTSPASSPF